MCYSWKKVQCLISGDLDNRAKIWIRDFDGKTFSRMYEVSKIAENLRADFFYVGFLNPGFFLIVQGGGCYHINKNILTSSKLKKKSYESYVE